MYHSANVRQGPGSMRVGGQGECAALRAFRAPRPEPRAGLSRRLRVDGRDAKRGRTLPARNRLGAVHLSRQPRQRGAVRRPRTVRPLRRRPEGAGEGREPSRRTGSLPGGARRAPRLDCRRAVSVHHGFAAVAPEPVRAPIPHNAPNQTVRVNDIAASAAVVPLQVTKVPRARDARLRPQRTLVYGACGFHAIRRDVPRGRNPGRMHPCRLTAATSRPTITRCSS